MRVLLFFVLLVGFTSCNEEYYTYETKEDNKMVLNGFFYPDEPSYLSLSKVNKLFDKVEAKEDYISGANIVVKDITAQASFTLTEDKPGSYIVDQPIFKDHTYEISVEKEGYESLKTKPLSFVTKDYGILTKISRTDKLHEYILAVFSEQEVEKWPIFMVDIYGLKDGETHGIRHDFNFNNYTGVCYTQLGGYIFDHNCRKTLLNYDFTIDKHIGYVEGVVVDKGVVEISIMPTKYYEYFEGMGQEGTFENGTLDPHITKSNIENGYGLVIPTIRTRKEF